MDQNRSPINIFGAKGEDSLTPRVFFAAHRYVQGAGVLSKIGEYLPLVGSRKPAILLPTNLPETIPATIALSIDGLETVSSDFGGECSYEEVDRQIAFFRMHSIDALIVAGGGKVIDAAKCIAYQLNVPLIVCPTLASTDAPCSAAAVVYTEDGHFKNVEFFPSNPNLVIVDTSVVAKAPPRFLAAGMADGLATGYEVQACIANQNARSMVGGRISLAALAIANLCTETIYRDGLAAYEAVQAGNVTLSLENVVEANTLLSGTGFESGGLAAAHAMATALTFIPVIERNFLHGEMVAIGLLTQLMLEKKVEEFMRARNFLHLLNLPVKYADLNFDVSDESAIEGLAKQATGLAFMLNEPFPVSISYLIGAIRDVDAAA